MTLEPITRLDRAQGALLGMAVGDALGAPLEGLSAQQIRSCYKQVVDYVDGARAWRDKPFRWRSPGLYSDDTQQALILAEVLVRHRRIDPERIVTLYRALANPREGHLGAYRGIGRTLREVIQEWERGASPTAAAKDSAGISAAARIAPLAIYYAERPDQLTEAVLDVGLMTHRDVRALLGAVAVAHAIRHLAAGVDRVPSFLFRLAADIAQAEERVARDYADRVVSLARHGKGLSTCVAHVESVLERPRDQALSALMEEANRHGAEPFCKRPTMGFPPVCVPTCLYLLLTADSFEEALTEVVNMGGDADSAGAILGAFAGAAHGVESIPKRWLDGLQNREGIALRADALFQLGNDEFNRDNLEFDLPDLVAVEWQLSRRENAGRDRLLSARQNQNGGDMGANRRL